jgi:hypothetical protein
MSIRRNGFALLLALALLFAPATLAAEQAATGGFWQALTSWLISSLGLGDAAEGGYGFLPGGASAVNPGEEPEGGYGILPGG